MNKKTKTYEKGMEQRQSRELPPEDWKVIERGIRGDNVSVRKLWEWWQKGFAPTVKENEGDFAKHVHREPNRMADTWATKAAWGQEH